MKNNLIIFLLIILCSNSMTIALNINSIKNEEKIKYTVRNQFLRLKNGIKEESSCRIILPNKANEGEKNNFTLNSKGCASILYNKSKNLFGPTDMGSSSSYAKWLGIWGGQIEVESRLIKIVFIINIYQNSLTAMMNSSVQGIKNLSVSKIVIMHDSLKIEVGDIGGIYEGIYQENQIISGNWEQNGQKFGLNLMKTDKNFDIIDSEDNMERVKEIVEAKINEWQKKGMFEKTTDYLKRVNEDTRKTKTEEFVKEAINDLAIKTLGLNFNYATDEYDADNEIFKINFPKLQPMFLKLPIGEARTYATGDNENFKRNFPKLQPIFLKVPIAEARTFDKDFHSLVIKDAQFSLDQHGEFILNSAEIINPNNRKEYKYDSNIPMSFVTANLNLKFDPIKLDITTEVIGNNVKEETKEISVGKSDVDVNLPITHKVNNNAVALIMGISSYQDKDIPTVKYAKNDAMVLRDYLITTLGYNPQNILPRETDKQLTYAQIKTYIQKILPAYLKPDGSSDIFIYYAGHGAPNTTNNDAYLVPWDCDPNYVNNDNAYDMKQFFADIKNLKARHKIVVVDACFSGQAGNGTSIIKNASSAILRINNPLIADTNMVIFQSSKENQVSNWYDEKRHGMFTYFFLKGMQGAADLNGDGKITADEMIKYINNPDNGLPYFSNRLYLRPQDAQVAGDRNMIIERLNK